MSKFDQTEALKPQMVEWMKHLHRHPELSMQEKETSVYIASQLRTMGYDVTENIGQFGIVATLKCGDSPKTIGLRADFDALPIQENSPIDYRSENPGKSHLCGHDGHTTMLLGAAKYLSQSKNFAGTLRLIFQPGEETMQGGPAMISDGLFERFPVDAVYGMHNFPELEKGVFYFHEGETMAAVDNWEIELTGKGTHGSMPETGIDPVVCGASLVMALQTVISRNISGFSKSVLTVGAFLAGSAGNVVPQNAILRLSIRNMDESVRSLVLRRIREITKSQAESFNCTYEIREGIPGAVLVNTPEETRFAKSVAKATFGEERVRSMDHGLMGSEDFAFMLQKRPGTYVLLGNGDTPMVHHPAYHFDLDLLPVGAAYWISLVEAYLKK